jgi:threonylcarbamoyladenosine tRNA methylthiotransferase MtaB
MQQKPSVLIHTLGCKVNQYDSERMRNVLVRRGFSSFVDGESEPELIIVNTCSVTHDSDRKSRQMIRKLVRRYPNARMVVSGCYSERKPQELHAIDGVSDVVPIAQQETFLQQLIDSLGWGCDDQDSLWDAGQNLEVFQERTRAFVKIQDGCDLRCTFCSIPTSRGAARSRPIIEVMEECRSLVDHGYPEIVLCGVCIGRYGYNEGFGLHTLLKEMVTIPGIKRIRISSMEPQDVSDEFLITMQEHQDIICPHLHLPLQSGSNKILRRMKRPYSHEFFTERVEKARSMIDDFEISTDIMVGFPDESDEDFEDTLNAVTSCRFNKVHSFRFSVREEAPAARMKNHLQPPVLEERRIQLDALANETAEHVKQSYIGKTLPILAEVEEEGFSTGFTSNYLRTQFTCSTPIPKGEIVNVHIERVEHGRLHGYAIP